MLVSENIDYYAGIFCFNPLDDPYHLERIDTCIKSIIRSAKHAKLRIKIVVGLNMSIVDGNKKIVGVGEKTREEIKEICNLNEIEIIEYNGINANSRGYSMLLEDGKNNTDSRKVVVFADDYIVPFFWFDIMEKNFEFNKDISFITPITSFVAQENLRVMIENHPSWDIRVAEKGDHKRWDYQTIYGGVEISHIDNIAKKFVYNGTTPWTEPPSFETTVFKRELLLEVGEIHPEYHSCFYDSDYFKMIAKKSFKGLIAKNCFTFHYGKGGTKSFYKETADEKYINSPVEGQLNKDIEIWNRRWNQNVKPWWGEK